MPEPENRKKLGDLPNCILIILKAKNSIKYPVFWMKKF